MQPLLPLRVLLSRREERFSETVKSLINPIEHFETLEAVFDNPLLRANLLQDLASSADDKQSRWPAAFVLDSVIDMLESSSDDTLVGARSALDDGAGC